MVEGCGEGVFGSLQQRLLSVEVRATRRGDEMVGRVRVMRRGGEIGKAVEVVMPWWRLGQ